jgi:hypothetical protein
MIGQSKIGSNSQVIFITLFSSSLAGVTLHCCAFHEPQQSVQKCLVKTNLPSKLGMFSLFVTQSYCARSHAGSLRSELAHNQCWTGIGFLTYPSGTGI